MARKKTTITVDVTTLAEARRLAGTSSASATIDLALTRLIRSEQIRSDVLAYLAAPPTADEVGLAQAIPESPDLADDTDWEELYAREPA